MHKIYPSFGTAVFFECTFKNPYPEEQVFEIVILDDELKYGRFLAALIMYLQESERSN